MAEGNGRDFGGRDGGSGKNGNRRNRRQGELLNHYDGLDYVKGLELILVFCICGMTWF